MKDWCATVVEVGDTITFDYGAGNQNNRTVQIRAIVDKDVVVMREQQRKGRGWRYSVERMNYFEVSRSHWTKVNK